MKSEVNKQFSFATDLKASNISVNIVSLDEYSKQIELLLEQIVIDGNGVAQKNLESSKTAIKESQKASPMDRINEYIKFGEQMQFLIPEVSDNTNKKYLKRIAVCYLDIAKIVNDEKVKSLSFAVADQLIDNAD